ncbi:hypothetical protein EIP91_009000 [Steccherinum ochraceum]|uniref:Aminoglycoside phosphotransferase domain-containing protein n=1 Tax=Steccherinum ochraceum TaxID=92696 RepID=A0A4R0R7T0_9APHY|nr:hypothetical protein EIP91_009000 [Steccherinum ochraceum]
MHDEAPRTPHENLIGNYTATQIRVADGGRYDSFYARFFSPLLCRFKLGLYTLLTYPSAHACEFSTRFFRLGIPLVFKRTDRLISTEADALQFLNGVVPHLPIPKLVDTFQLDGATYTVMTRLPGCDLEKSAESSPEAMEMISQDVIGILDELWRIPRPSHLPLGAMLSASGHGLPHPKSFREVIAGPYDDARLLYESMGVTTSDLDSETLDTITNDPMVFVHTDLRMQNVLVHKGRVSGIIDWEDAGWLPRHWLLHILRRPRPGCRGIWRTQTALVSNMSQYLNRPRITLTPNSVYVYTVPIMGSNAFHWCLVYVSEDGTCSSHQWVQDTKASAFSIAKDGIEHYHFDWLANGSSAPSYDGQSPVLAYFRVMNPAPKPQAFMEACKHTFAGQSRSTVDANRAAQITCRTWITKVLGTWMSEAQALEIENTVTTMSRAANNKFASSYLSGQAFQTEAHDIL